MNYTLSLLFTLGVFFVIAQVNVACAEDWSRFFSKLSDEDFVSAINGLSDWELTNGIYFLVREDPEFFIEFFNKCYGLQDQTVIKKLSKAIRCMVAVATKMRCSRKSWLL
ncbi:MAG: hypothetical protein LBB20_01400 [Puniceicoccales bacterium]|jgi:hypothetical protein|nr:hypothetical protein [Puniceicoccales bacterium]